MVRAGSRALSVFASPLNVRVLRAHADDGLPPGGLEAALAWAAPSSLRAAVGELTELNALAPLDSGSEPSRALGLTPAGRELLDLALVVEEWLQGAPDGPVPLEDEAARGIVKVLVAAWNSTMVRALAERPYTLIELDARIRRLNYPALKRRLATLRATHLVVPVDTAVGAGYVAGDWLRRAALLLARAVRWERRHAPACKAPARLEFEAILLLALPLVRLPGSAVGACTLAVLLSDSGARRNLASVSVTIDGGAIATIATEPPVAEVAFALGTVDAWLEAVLDRRTHALRFAGTKRRLATTLIEALAAERCLS